MHTNSSRRSILRPRRTAAASATAVAGLFRAALACCLAFALLLAAPALGGFTGTAFAEPEDATSGVDEAPERIKGEITLPWSELGLDPEVDLYPDSSRRFAIPVPAGLNVVRVQGVMHTPMNIDAGYLEISDGDGDFLAGVNLPPASPGLVLTPFSVDIPPAPVPGRFAELTFTVRALDRTDRVCGPTQRLTVSRLETAFSGVQRPPNTIQDFLPALLEDVTIYAPTDADAAEQEAVLAMVSAVSRLYYPRPPTISVVNQRRGAVPPPAFGLSRAIVVERGEPGLEVVDAGQRGVHLRVTGEGEDLPAQVSVVLNQLQGLAQSTSARVEQGGAQPGPSGDVLTFKELKLGGKTSFIKTGSLRVGVDRTVMGPRFDRVKVHLLADYTPVSDQLATVVVRAQDEVVYREQLDGTGVLDASFELGGDLLDKQWINLEFDFTYTPDQPCGPLLAPITFEIDPRSSLTVHRGGSPLGGFAAFPPEFSPEFVVAFDGSSPNQLAYAGKVVAAVAGLTRAQLVPRVVDLQSAADAKSGALIVADSQAVKQLPLTPPVIGDGSLVNIALPTELQIDVEGGLGSIQAFVDGARNRSVVLVTTTSDWGLVEPLLREIDGTEGRWSELKGDVLAAGAAGDPVNVAIRTANEGVGAAGAGTGTGTSALRSPAAVIGGALAGIAVLGGLVYVLRRRSRSGTDPVEP